MAQYRRHPGVTGADCLAEGDSGTGGNHQTEIKTGFHAFLHGDVHPEVEVGIIVGVVDPIDHEFTVDAVSREGAGCRFELVGHKMHDAAEQQPAGIITRQEASSNGNHPSGFQGGLPVHRWRGQSVAMAQINCCITFDAVAVTDLSGQKC